MLKNEFLIMVVIFLFLALGMHMTQWLSHPLEHLYNLSNHKMPYHPLLYTALVYLIIGVCRVVFHLLLKLFRKK